MTPFSRWIRLLSAVLLLSGAQAAVADQFHKLVKYECLSKVGRLVISLKGAYNEEGKQMLRTKGANEWDPWSLVDLKDDKNETRIIGTRSIRKICRLRDGIYRVEIHPSPGNVNILGSCGGEMSAGVVVEKAAATVVRTDFEGDCHGDDPVIVEVEVRAGSRSPRIRRVPKAEFYK